MRHIIIEKIREIEQKEKVQVIFAIESGSRAWGFESPDSDYDVRFVYVRQRNDYLRIDSFSDVLEFEITDSLDIVGWDLKKALFLIRKSNPSFFEWLSSPIVYVNTDLFEEFKILSKKFYNQKTLAHHYFSMSKRDYGKHVCDNEYVLIKKYFYVLRELLACKFVLDKKDTPPMRFNLLVEEYKDELDIEIINDLVQQKKVSNEKILIKSIQSLNEYIVESHKELSFRLSNLHNTSKGYESLNRFLIKGIDWYEDKVTTTST